MGMYPRDERDQAFADYYAACGARMRATAYLLCGDWHRAEDLTQAAFIKLYRAWRRVERHDKLDQYLRRVLLRTFLDDTRRPWRRERPAGDDRARFDQPVRGPDVDSRLVLRAALTSLPPRQRAAVVLRFWEDLSIEQTGEVLGCPAGTVKSLTARGLEAMRTALGTDFHLERQAAAGGAP
ncbi:SigE family RNA polymerase sigma factor [Actinomycetes bacterium KLBMP 9797]